MQKVENDMFVSVDYTGTLESGEVFDTTDGKEAMEIQIGAGQLIQGFEEALMGMTLNEKKTFTLEPEAAYGGRDETLVHDFPRSQIPSDMDPRVGQMLALSTPEGKQLPAWVSSVDAENITIDLNHPLAGQSLTFEIEVVGISATPTRDASGCGCGCDCSSGSC